MNLIDEYGFYRYGLYKIMILIILITIIGYIIVYIISKEKKKKWKNSSEFGGNFGIGGFVRRW